MFCLRGGAQETSDDHDDSEDDTATGDNDDESGLSRAGAPAYGAGTVEDSYVSRYAAAESCSPKRKGFAASDTLLTEAFTPACVCSQEDDDEDGEDSSGGAQQSGAAGGSVTRPDGTGNDGQRRQPKMSNLERFIGCTTSHACTHAPL